MSTQQRKILILGAGDIGRRAFHELAQSHVGRHVVLAGRDDEVVMRAVNSARFCALQRGFAPSVAGESADVDDVAQTAEVIARVDPDVVFLAVSYQSWWVISTLPKPAFERLYEANFGPWLPMHLVPVMKAMEAVRLSGTRAVVVNAAFPDAVHPALAAIGASPAVGIGNVANNVPGIRAAVADHLACSPLDLDVRLVAHHYVSHRLSRSGGSGPAEMGLAVLREGQDVTRHMDLAAVLERLPSDYRRTGGVAGHTMTVASALSVLEPLVDQRDALVHAPGPNGAIGGYPVMIEDGRVVLRLPPGMTADEALAINLSGQTADGIADIDEKGTVTFVPEAMDVLGTELGYECDRMALADAEECALELGERFARYRDRVTAEVMRPVG